MPPTSRGPLPYEEISKQEYADRAARDNFRFEEPEPGCPFLRGSCPRCDDPMIFEIPRSIVYKGPLRMFSIHRSKAETDGRDCLVLCTCTHDHPGRPAEDEGCGAYWTLHLEMEHR